MSYSRCRAVCVLSSRACAIAFASTELRHHLKPCDKRLIRGWGPIILEQYNMIRELDDAAAVATPQLRGRLQRVDDWLQVAEQVQESLS